MSHPTHWLRLEGLAVFIFALISYAHQGANGWLFVLLLFAPDLSMIGYLRDAKLGATLYNLVHSYAVVFAFLTFALARTSPELIALALIWFAHIGLDRALGYGLKYPTGFEQTHLGVIGKAKATLS